MSQLFKIYNLKIKAYDNIIKSKTSSVIDVKYCTWVSGTMGHFFSQKKQCWLFLSFLFFFFYIT